VRCPPRCPLTHRAGGRLLTYFSFFLFFSAPTQLTAARVGHLSGIIRGKVESELSDVWYSQQAVYRVSLGNFVRPLPSRPKGNTVEHSGSEAEAGFDACGCSGRAQLFFAGLSCVLMDVKTRGDRRCAIHHDHWAVKVGVWVLLTVLPFFLPNDVIMAYGASHSAPSPGRLSVRCDESASLASLHADRCRQSAHSSFQRLERWISRDTGIESSCETAPSPVRSSPPPSVTKAYACAHTTELQPTRRAWIC
jgi:hypothetical protein